METKQGTFSVEEVQGKPIAEAITEAIAKAKAQEPVDAVLVSELEAMTAVNWSAVPFTFRQYASNAEYASAWSDKDILKLVNKAEESREKSKEYQARTKALRPDPKSPEVKRASMIKTLIDTFGYTEQAAESAVDVLIAQGKSL